MMSEKDAGSDGSVDRTMKSCDGDGCAAGLAGSPPNADSSSGDKNESNQSQSNA